jgi:hypothetical protein
MHKRMGLAFVPLDEVVGIAVAQTRIYLAKIGPHGLAPQRKEPYLNQEIAGMLGREECTVNGTRVAPGSLRWRSLRGAVALQAQTGFRGSEVVLGRNRSFDSSSISRASISWRIGGVDVSDPSEEQLRNLREGDYCLIIPPPSKCDQFGIAWGNAPIYLAWHAGRPICAARELQALELAWPVHGKAREEAPLFVDDAKRPLTRAWLADAVKQLMLDTGASKERVAALSLHSFRRYLACALLARLVPEAQICALLRWRSTKSLAAYAALNASAYAGLVDDAANASIDSIRTCNMGRVPITTADEVAANLSLGARRAAQDAGRTLDEADRMEAEDADEEDA